MDGYGKRVLVVEDNASARTLICFILSEAGYNVYEAGDGLEALDALKKRRYDAVLTDYHLPKMDGLELLDLAQMRWPHTPVILASSDTFVVEQLQTTPLAQAYAVLPKPFDSSALLHTVRCATYGLTKPLNIVPKTIPSNPHQDAA